MALETSSNRMPPYAGGPSALQFPFTFFIRSKDDLEVYLEDEDRGLLKLIRGTDYQVNINPNAQTGGAVVLLDADQTWLDANGILKAGYFLHILRVVAVKQPISIKNGGPFYPETHEKFFDYITMIAQQHEEVIKRALKLPLQLLASEFDPTLPADLAGAAECTIITTADGKGLKRGPTKANLQAALDAASEAAYSATAAASSAAAADASADAADVSEANASASATSAALSAGSAANSELASELAKDDAADAKTDAQAAAAAAAASATLAAQAAVPNVLGTRSAPLAIVPATGITFDNANPSRYHIYFLNSNGGEKTITMSPQISNATGGASAIGKRVTLRGRSDTDYLKLESARGLSLNGPMYLTLNASISLEWDGADWVELCRSER
jgi:hypothetical protein